MERQDLQLCHNWVFWPSAPESSRLKRSGKSQISKIVLTPCRDVRVLPGIFYLKVNFRED
jgi:hypothetical protein